LSSHTVVIDGQSRFSDELMIIFDYDSSALLQDVPAQDQLVAAYYHEGTGAWKALPFALHEAEGKLVLPVDHLTRFAVFRYKDGLSMAREVESAGVLSTVPVSGYEDISMELFSEYFNQKMRGARVTVEKVVDRAGDTVQSFVDGTRTASNSIRERVSSGIRRVSDGASDLYNWTRETISGFGESARDLWDEVTSPSLMSALEGYFDLNQVISQYATDNFHFYFLMEEHEEMDMQGYIYSNGSGSGISYGHNYLEYSIVYEVEGHAGPYGGTARMRKKLVEYEQQQSSYQQIPARFVVLGEFFEEAHRSYTSKLGAIEAPVNVFITEKGDNPAEASPYHDNIRNSLYIPYVNLVDESCMRQAAGHELFHVYQRNKGVSALAMKTNLWLMEATAEYAAYYEAF